MAARKTGHNKRELKNIYKAKKLWKEDNPIVDMNPISVEYLKLRNKTLEMRYKFLSYEQMSNYKRFQIALYLLGLSESVIYDKMFNEISAKAESVMQGKEFVEVDILAQRVYKHFKIPIYYHTVDCLKRGLVLNQEPFLENVHYFKPSEHTALKHLYEWNACRDYFENHAKILENNKKEKKREFWRKSQRKGKMVVNEVGTRVYQRAGTPTPTDFRPGETLTRFQQRLRLRGYSEDAIKKKVRDVKRRIETGEIRLPEKQKL